MDVQMSIDPPNLEFTKRLPKVELHAHLSGSIDRDCLQRLWQHRKARDPKLDLQAPSEAMPVGKVDYDIKTFFPLFSNYIYRLCNSIESIRLSTFCVLKNFESDGVAYLELRTIPRAIPTQEISRSLYVETVLSCVEEYQSSSMRTYLILCIDRKNSAEEAMEIVDLAIQYKLKGVVGIDICGNPSKGDVSLYNDAFRKAKSYGLGITVHFAEVPASSTDAELRTLLSYEPDRLGHAIHIPDNLKSEITRKRPGLELCLSCNILTKLTTGGFADHHFGYWRDKGCPIALSTDDVGIFCSPLSNEYMLAAEHFGLSKLDLLGLSRQACSVIFGSQDDKAQLEYILNIFETELLNQANDHSDF